MLRSGLVAAFRLWVIVQLAPHFRAAALLNDGAAFVLMPWRLTPQES